MERAVCSTDEAERLAQLAATVDDESWASWMVLPVDKQGATELIVLFARYRRGLVGETQRQIHAIGIVAGRLLAQSLTAACGARLLRAQLEFTAFGEGMPCERCVAKLSVNLPAADEATPELPDLPPDVDVLRTQFGHTSVSPPHRGPAEIPLAGQAKRRPGAVDHAASRARWTP
ncbi:hypothetical protein [Prauserella marina]|uniref:hypothetical protein n=1 Tax=Prauserella marina TaxID=530584 RepID=UPI00115FEBA7|nr:hypothetical protein [Prauserella marina]